jgi:hypothetical protein
MLHILKVSFQPPAPVMFAGLTAGDSMTPLTPRFENERE